MKVVNTAVAKSVSEMAWWHGPIGAIAMAVGAGGCTAPITVPAPARERLPVALDLYAAFLVIGCGESRGHVVVPENCELIDDVVPANG